jgi:hypothetical protein
MSILILSQTSYRELIVLIGSLNKDLAYLDPGSGSFILQILLATLLASLFFMKTFWRRVVGYFKKPSSPDLDESQDTSIDDDQDNK